MFQLDPSTRLVPPHASDPVQIDDHMVPLVSALWARGWHTMACCQDNGQAVEAERAQGHNTEPIGHHGFIEYHKGWTWLTVAAWSRRGPWSRS
jgi:hypothetical protein